MKHLKGSEKFLYKFSFEILLVYSQLKTGHCWFNCFNSPLLNKGFKLVLDHKTLKKVYIFFPSQWGREHLKIAWAWEKF